MQGDAWETLEGFRRYAGVMENVENDAVILQLGVLDIATKILYQQPPVLPLPSGETCSTDQRSLGVAEHRLIAPTFTSAEAAVRHILNSAN